MAASNLTHARLLEVLHYDPATGVFTWKINCKGPVKAGRLAGTPNSRGYLRIMINGVSYLANRLAWFYENGVWPAQQVDHQDGIKTRNAFLNLRDIGGGPNQQNRKRANRNSVTGILGVSPGRHGGFVARIYVDGRHKSLGTFKTTDAASAAYVEAKRDLHPGNLL